MAFENISHRNQERRVILVPAVGINNNICHTHQANQEFKKNNIIIIILRNKVLEVYYYIIHDALY